MPVEMQAQRNGRPPDIQIQHLTLLTQISPQKSIPTPSSSKDVPKRHKKHSPARKEADVLQKLLSLLSTSRRGSTTTSDSDDDGAVGLRKSLQWPTPQPKGGPQENNEAMALEKFSLCYQQERHFSRHAHHKYFFQIFSALVTERLGNIQWSEVAPPENILRVLVCLRIMMRDAGYQKEFYDLGGVKVLSKHFQKATDSYMTYGDGPYVVEILKQMTNIFQKLSAVEKQREWLVDCGAHKALVLLLSANDIIVLLCSLHALASLAQSPEPRRLIAELNSLEVLLRILQDYDMLPKKLAANVLRLLCADGQAREMIKVYDGIPLFLSLLHSDNIKLLWNVVWCVVQLSSDSETSNDIRQMGGIPLLLSLLHERKFVSDRSVGSSGLSSAAVQSPAIAAEEEGCNYFFHDVKKDPLTEKQAEEMKELQLSLKSAICACLTELSLNDNNAQQIVQSNGIYLMSQLILPPEQASEKDKQDISNLQANAFRALRFLFSMERNRRLLLRLFPPEILEPFIDIGHYKRDIGPYHHLVAKLNSLPQKALEEIAENIYASNLNREPSHFIADYAVLEHLGSGAFGCVYKVKKKTAGQSYLAMKEISGLGPSMGKGSKDRDKSVGEMISELNIIREQLRHPNVVRYYKTFVEQNKLYIVMELIEGAPIREHFDSLKEKGEKFSEERIWHIFIQLVLALRYLHKEKHIVHRDLTPNNIMLGENDKVTITDFGLAKQKQKDCSKMNSVVGTILYSCPEIVQNQPYSEKADVWAIGCVLYQMCALKPPFYSSNILTLSTKIVEGEYEPIPDGDYSEKVISTIRKCITVSPDDRPDIVQVAAFLADIILVHMDGLCKEQINLEKRLEREKRRTQKHFHEADRGMQHYHRLFQMSQDRYDKLVNLASSGGGQSMKDESDLTDGTDGVLSDPDQEEVVKNQTNSICGTMEPEPEDRAYNTDSGWASDDDPGGSTSQESKGGPSSKGVIPRPPEQGTPRSRRKPRSMEQYGQALTVEIPTKCSRDSGISSGDPSPNNSSPPSDGDPETRTRPRPKSLSCVQRSSSTPSLDVVVRRGTASARVRPTSANKSTLSISPKKVRQISDPILQMLHILHKIIYITQLPPTLCHNPRRRVIERFKRALFAPQSTSFNLKNELKKLLTGSRELIDLNLGPKESPGLSRQVSHTSSDNSGDGVYDTEAEEVGVTYEQMQSVIESVLVESGYYDMSPGTRTRTTPFSPVGTVEAFISRHLGFNSA